VEIAIISDTHMPKGWRRLPQGCVERLRAADLIVHAGDLSTLAVLRELQTYGRVVAVHGNVDDSAARAALPAAAVVEAGGARLAVIHDAGSSRGRLERMRRRFAGGRVDTRARVVAGARVDTRARVDTGAGVDAVVFGHSHVPLHERAADGFQIFNPGSPTERRRAAHHTMGICRALGGTLTFELVDLD
jgi:predicted phosphodiesterase